jgi:heme exporter protein A
MIDPRQLPPRALKVYALACRRGERTLFEHVDFSLEAGQILLLRGPNGVGKTTLLSALAGIIAPAEGTIEFSGSDPDGRPETEIHFLGHLGAVKPRLTVAENLEFWAALNDGTSQPIETALDRVGLADLMALDAGVLSAGQTRRLALARLLISERPIWLLDEPTAALDAGGELLVAGLIDRHLDLGGLVVATTHHDLALRNVTRVKTLVLGETPREAA